MKKDDKTVKSETKIQSVKDLPADLRPREKLLKFGLNAMNNYELIAILLRTGTKGKSVIDVSKELLKKFNKLEYFFEASMNELRDSKLGIGLAKSAELYACIGLARRYADELLENEKKKLMNQQSITSPSVAVDAVRMHISDFSKEHFFVVSLDTRNRITDISEVSTGSLTASVVHPRETFETAIRKHAAGIIVFHNHPSGDCDPSSEDINITKRLFEAGKILGIDLLDHIIISKSDYLSMRDRGYI